MIKTSVVFVVLGLAALVVLFALGFLSHFYISQPRLLPGFVRAWVDVEPGVILLQSKCQQLKIFTSEDQTASIYSGMLGEIQPRPVAHDLLVDIAEEFDVQILAAAVERLEARTYYSSLFIKRGNKILSLDARPSDAIAIAVRANAPIYVSTDLLENYGEKVC